ncbi:hypothetical protein AnigIFM63326_009134 [Aspergillus niger]|nr:hypothetical protein AnigIFM63326_009134 [Aspergillus niger]
MGNHISYERMPHEIDLGNLGRIRGLQFDNKARRYARIPYALPPIGPYRWRKPRPLPLDYSYSGPDGIPLDATLFGPVCPQASFSSSAEKAPSPDLYSEDCLLLNIWTPVTMPPPGKRWPVVLWLHGGWFAMGDPLQEPGMDATELISTAGLQAIVVGIGYRLNIFGFLAGETLLAANEDGDAGAGNFGLWDQRIALEWVHAHIHRFGGDPDNITLGGRSAGAYGVHAQLLYHCQHDANERRLFRRIYMYSNAIPGQPKTLAEAQPQFDEVCRYFKLDPTLSPQEKLEQLHQVDAADLLAAMGFLQHHTFRPVTDGDFIRPGFNAYHRSGELAAQFLARDLRLLIGEVLNEETLYATYNSPEARLVSLRNQLANYYAPRIVDRVLPHYSLPAPDSPVAAWKALFGTIVADGQVRAPSRYLIHCLATHGVPLTRIWRYQIAYRLSFITERVAPLSFGIAHAMDKPFWNYSIMHDPTAPERELMNEWIKILVSFVHDDNTYEFGTQSLDEFKVATPQGMVQVKRDPRWQELVKLGEVFSDDV